MTERLRRTILCFLATFANLGFPMDYNATDLGSWQARFVVKLGKKLRSNKKYSNEAVAKENAKRRSADSRIRQSTDNRGSGPRGTNETNELGERNYSSFSQAATLLNHDNTEMMHGLTHRDSFDSLMDGPSKHSNNQDLYLNSYDEKREHMVANLPDEIWTHITSFLNAADCAHLALSNKTLHDKLSAAHLPALWEDENKTNRIVVLQHMDARMKDYLLCFPCGAYHKRTSPQEETLKADYVVHPIFDCPNARNTVLPRIRLVHGRELPYYFVQLAVRGSRYSPSHGITPRSLERSWRCKDSTWSHRTRYMYHRGRLLLRVVSQSFATPNLTATGQRHLLYDREEYTPFFSVCSHWRDGLLMPICKCALSHVPESARSVSTQLRSAPRVSNGAARPNHIVSGCSLCAPMRRCPECPTEYLIEVRMLEDPKDPVNTFKHALVVTRWSDLGDGTNPYTSPEWAALKGLETAEHYESFSQIGRRAVSGIFESAISGSVPTKRLLSLNPKLEHQGEEGNGWY